MSGRTWADALSRRGPSREVWLQLRVDHRLKGSRLPVRFV